MVSRGRRGTGVDREGRPVSRAASECERASGEPEWRVASDEANGDERRFRRMDGWRDERILWPVEVQRSVELSGSLSACPQTEWNT